MLSIWSISYLYCNQAYSVWHPNQIHLVSLEARISESKFIVSCNAPLGREHGLERGNRLCLPKERMVKHCKTLTILFGSRYIWARASSRWSPRKGKVDTWTPRYISVFAQCSMVQASEAQSSQPPAFAPTSSGCNPWTSSSGRFHYC